MPENDSALLHRIRGGDERAFEALVREHYNGLCVFAAQVSGQGAIAEEIVQEVLLRIWQMRDRLTLTGRVSSYLYASVRNRALSELGRQRKGERWRDRVLRGTSPQLTVGSVQAADEEVQLGELEHAIESAILALPPRCREAYSLRCQGELSYLEIAEIMHTSPKTVEVQIGKALKLLRRRLADWL